MTACTRLASLASTVATLLMTRETVEWETFALRAISRISKVVFQTSYLADQRIVPRPSHPYVEEQPSLTRVRYGYSAVVKDLNHYFWAARARTGV